MRYFDFLKSLIYFILVSIFFCIIFLSHTVAFSQNPEWINLTSGSDILALVDDGNYLWVGGGGLTRLNKATNEMTFYNRSNSGLPDNRVIALAVDSAGNKWIGTFGGGLAKFNGTDWEVYNTQNSGLPHDRILDITIDSVGNKWIGTKGGGLAVYHEEGVLITAVEEEHSIKLASNLLLFQSYPNPFNPSTKISFSVLKQSYVSIVISNILGELVRELTNQDYSLGVYEVQWNGTNSEDVPVSSGVYFYRMTTVEGSTMKKMILLR